MSLRFQKMLNRLCRNDKTENICFWAVTRILKMPCYFRRAVNLYLENL